MLCVVFDVFSHKNCLNWMHYSILCHHSIHHSARWDHVVVVVIVVGVAFNFALCFSHSESRCWIWQPAFAICVQRHSRVSTACETSINLCTPLAPILLLFYVHWIRTAFMPLFYCLAVLLTDRQTDRLREPKRARERESIPIGARTTYDAVSCKWCADQENLKLFCGRSLSMLHTLYDRSMRESSHAAIRRSIWSL